MAGWVDRQVDAWFDRRIEPSKTVHNGVARLDRIEATINRVTRYLP